MHEALFTLNLDFLNLVIVITGWKLVGYSGVMMFASRWFVQLWASTKSKKPTFPLLFWLISMVGSVLALSYWIFGKNDSVGILQNLFPFFIALYNLILELSHRKRENAT